MKFKKFILEHKTKIIFTIILTVIAIFFCYTVFANFFPKFIQKLDFENNVLSFANKNKDSVFSIEEITLFSSSDAKNKASSQTNFTIENLYAYTDMAIFIKQTDKEKTLKNTLKEVRVENIEINPLTTVGQANIYYKNVNDFAKPYIPETQPITDTLTFKTTSEETPDFSEPLLYNNCASPITLSYVNENIKTDYTLLDITNPITYNGSLLKRCGIALSQIATKISFDMFITNYQDETFKSKIFIDIPYQTDTSSIYDGNITIKQNVNYVFYRI